MENVFSVDLEDWYQGLEIDLSDWGRFLPRLEHGLLPLLDLLASAGVTATFFVLGAEAERAPDLIRRVIAAGHEIGSHGWSHRFVYRQTRDTFQSELRRSKELLEQLSGQPVHGYRAPFFSITEDSRWALDVLVEEGFHYDSSIFPIFNYRYGIASASRTPGWIRTPSGGRLFEIPLSTLRILAPGRRAGVNLPLGGGGYFRLYPYALTRQMVARLTRDERLVFYVHPWEYDPHHPRIRMPRWVPEQTHYFNLASTLGKTRRLLADFRFTSMRGAFAADYLAPPPD